jgi:hypothetical protein
MSRLSCKNKMTIIKRKECTNVIEQPPLKLIVAYDRGRNEYSIPAHNQTPEEAETYRNTWSTQLRPDCSFIVLDQSERHKEDDAQKCRACRHTVVRSANLQPQPKFRRRNE